MARLFLCTCIVLIIANIGVSLAETSKGASVSFEQVGSIKVKRPAFLEILDLGDGENLFVSSFGKNIQSSIYIVPGFTKSGADLASIKPSLFTDELSWPNETSTLELDGERYLVVANGFFNPPFSKKIKGSIAILDASGEMRLKLGEINHRWFYHQPVLRDMDGDGLQDIVTARSNFSPFPFSGKPKGELVFFKNPGNLLDAWNETKILDGPSVYFRFFDLDNDGIDEIIAPLIFQKKLMVYKKDRNGDFVATIVTDSIGSPFDVRLVDLNADGKVEILTTNHESDLSAGAFAFSFEFDDNGQANFTKKTLYQGIITRKKGIGQASPGTAQPYYLEGFKKPLIVISGDGSQSVHLLVPTTEDSTNWEYEHRTLITTADSIIGGILIHDIDQDGRKEILVPAYHANEILIYKPSL